MFSCQLVAHSKTTKLSSQIIVWISLLLVAEDNNLERYNVLVTGINVYRGARRSDSKGG